METDPLLPKILHSLGNLLDQLVDNHDEITRYREHSYMLLASVISHVLEDLDNSRLEAARVKLTQLQTFYRNRADH